MQNSVIEHRQPQPVATSRHQSHAGYENLKFTGTTKEYFGIWIVNILLTIVTFGIYSAWAKVRRQRYMRGHTTLQGHGFGYHATGKQIFLGRLLAFGFIILMALPIINILAIIALPFILPLFIHRSLRFNVAVTSYRNVRFHFTGDLGDAYKVFLLGPMLASMTFGIMRPIADRWRQEYVGSGMHYGDRSFKTKLTDGSVYAIWIWPYILSIATIISFIAIIFTIVFSIQTSSITPSGSILHIMVILSFYGIMFAMIFIWTIYNILLRNLAWSATMFDGKHPLRSKISVSSYLWVLVSNAFMTMITLGLMRPWAQIRMMRLIWNNTAICFTEDLGEIISEIENTKTPVAAEYLEFEGFDFGF